MKALENKVVIITGAASGMGRAMAKLFAAEGAQVIVSDMDLEGLNSLVGEIAAAGGKAKGLLVNVAREDEVEGLISTAVSTFGRLDVLVNNAGILDDFKTAAEVSDETWVRVMDVNLNGPFYACRAALNVMLKQERGVIINNASIGGLFGGRAGAAYTASKHGLIGLTRNIGFIYAKKGIRCNAIAPGGVKTHIADHVNPDPLGYEALSSGIGSNPRMAEPEELAQVALFLASDRSSFVNGAILVADGGWTAY